MRSNHSHSPKLILHLLRTPLGYQAEHIQIVQPSLNKTISDPEPESDPKDLSGELPRITHIEEAQRRDMTSTNVEFLLKSADIHSAEQNRQEADSPPKYTPIWFEMDTIHDLERRQVPEFFTGDSYKRPELYLKYRNFMVSLFRSNPTRYLTKIACRRVLKGDANAILRIHRFLQQQGIINFGLYPSGGGVFETSDVNKCADLALKCRKLQPASQPQETSQPSSQSLIFSATSRILSKNHRSFCIKCSLACGVVMFQRKQATSESCVCDICYLKMEEAEKAQYERSDVTKRIANETAANKNRSNWSADENYRMIEGLAEPNATWSSLYDKMGNKRTKEDIIFHFLQFPIVNVKTHDQPPAARAEPTVQEKLSPIRSLYEKSRYRYDLSDEDRQIFIREPMNEELKSIILLELEKYTKRLVVVEELESVGLMNEAKSNLQSLLLKMRMAREQVAPVPVVEAPIPPPTAVNPIAYEESEQSDPQNFFDEDDVDRYLD